MTNPAKVMKKAAVLAAAVLSSFLLPGVLQAAVIQTPCECDPIPNFAESPTIRSAKSGAWSDPTTWDLNRVPSGLDIVSIGHLVNYDSAGTTVKVVGIQAGGKLAYRTDRTTSLTVTTLLVMEGGELEIGTEASPLPPTLKAELIFADVPLNLTADPEQFGNGLVSLGRVRIHGAAKTPFARVAVEPKAGNITLTLQTPVSGWQAGDKLILPDSKHWGMESGPYVAEFEDAVIAGVSADGKTITLTAPLKYNHPGARNASGVLEPGFLPHAANRTRNVVLRSQNASGVRGHALFTHRADPDVRYAAFEGMGRTSMDPNSRIGRYPLHFHHLEGPVITPANGRQFTAVGNAVSCPLVSTPFRWGLTIHDSHYGLIKDNVVYNMAGAGIVTEDGSESFNVIEGNFVSRIPGQGDRMSENGGRCFWFRGPNNYVRNNVAANARENGVEAAYGYSYGMRYLGDIKVPNFKGADMSVAANYTVKDGNGIPVLEFSGNEVYGCPQGLTIWWVNAHDTTWQNGGKSVIKDFKAWHVYRYGFYGYPMSDVEFDGFTVRGDASLLSNNYEFFKGIYFGDYATRNFVGRRLDIQNMATGFIDPYFGGSTSRIEDSLFAGNRTDISVNTPSAPGSDPDPSNRRAKKLIVTNTRHLSNNTHISMDRQTEPSANDSVADEVFVYGYQADPNRNFQVFYNHKAPADAVSAPNIVGKIKLITSIQPTAPSIQTHPANQSVTAGQTAAFSVTATGTAPLLYQWQRNGADISGATAASYTTPVTVLADNGSVYRCSVRNGQGTVMSSGATLTVTAPLPPPNLAPVVSAGADKTITLPAGVSLVGTASDDGLPDGSVLTVTWSKASGPGTVTFANGSALSTTASFSAAGSYVLRLTATDGALSTSDTAAVTVSAAPLPPSITSHPASITVTAGQTASFSVTAAGTAPLSYQWQRNGSAIAGATSASYTTTAALADNGAQYRCVVTNTAGSATSSTATLTVSLLPPPLNQAPVVNAGADKAITLPANVSLTGMASDDGLPAGSVLTVSWSKVSGPGTATFSNGAALSTTVSFSAAGSYVLRFTATDGDLSASDDVAVTVSPEVIEPTDPPAVRILSPEDGVLSHAKRMEIRYEISGDIPAGARLRIQVDSRSPVTLRNDQLTGTYLVRNLLDGAHTVTLTLTDSARRLLTNPEATDSVSFTVQLNKRPVVDAGPDQTVARGQILALDGTVTDDGLPSGTLTTAWRKVSGPSGGKVRFADYRAVDTTVTFTMAGSYVLRLRANDGALGANDTVTVTVTP